ncbi:hypothetical protein [Salana multivorans]
MTRAARRYAPGRTRRALEHLRTAEVPAGDGPAYERGWSDALTHAVLALGEALDGRRVEPPGQPCTVAGCSAPAPPSAEACDAHRCTATLRNGHRCPFPAGKRGDHPRGQCPRCAQAEGRARAARQRCPAP